jgi:hypothetical protein
MILKRKPKHFKRIDLKRTYKNNLYKKLKKLSLLYKNKYLKYKIYIKIRQNNVFCTLKNIQTNIIILVASAGKLKVNVSKKKLFFLQKKITFKFLRKVRFILRSYKFPISIEFISPLKLRRQILKYLKFLLRKKRSLFLSFQSLKVLNGCRPKKKKRKKGLRFNIK